MKYYVTLFFLLGLNISALAEKPPTLHIEQIDPMVDIDKMKAPNVQVHKANQVDTDNGALPEPAKRDALIAKAGLGGLTKDWDEYALDKFFLNAKSLSTEKFIQTYPALSKERLKTYCKLVKRTRLANK